MDPIQELLDAIAVIQEYHDYALSHPDEGHPRASQFVNGMKDFAERFAGVSLNEKQSRRIMAAAQTVRQTRTGNRP